MVVDKNEIPLILDKETPHDDYIEYTFKLESPFKFSGNGENYKASIKSRGHVGDGWLFTDTCHENDFEWKAIDPVGLTKNDDGLWKKQEGAEFKVVYTAEDALCGYGITVTAKVQVQKKKALGDWNDEKWAKYKTSIEEVQDEYMGLIHRMEPTTAHTWKGKDPREVLEYADGEVESVTVTIKAIK